MKPETELIQGIEEQTEEEIRRIREELARVEGDRAAAAEREIEAAKREISDRTAMQLRRIDKATKAAVATELHKIELETRERFFEQVMAAAAARLHDITGQERYRSILKGWIVEAAVGLAADEALVSASAEEMPLCVAVLPEAEAEIRGLLGHAVKLRPSDAPPPFAQGVLLTAASGRTAYNNQVPTRIMRRQSAIRGIIYEELSRLRDGRPTREETGQSDG